MRRFGATTALGSSMTASRAFLVSLLLPAVAVFTVPAARAEPASPDRSAREAAKPFVELAQKTDDGDEDNERKGGRHKGKRDRGDGGGAGSGPPPDAQGGQQNPRQSKDEARKQKQLERQQGKQELLKKKQDADAARQDALKQRQLDAQQAKDKALQNKRDADAARKKALEEQRQQAKDRYLGKKPDNTDAARKDFEQKQLESQQAKDKALRDKRDADAARQNAFPEQQRRDRDRVRRPEKFDRAKVDQDFERARKEAQQKSGGDRSERFRADKANKFEALRKGRKTREVGSRDIIVEPDKRVIVRDDKRVFIRHDDGERFRRKGKEVRRERRKDGTWMVVTAGLAGAMIYSILDENDRVLRRSRRDRDGREYVFFDDRRSYRDHYGPEHYSYVDLPPPVVRMPRDRYIVDYDRASPDDIYDALNAPPIEDLGRGYTLDEVRQNYSILERMRRVDLNSINFEFASWDVSPDQYPKLERIARAMHRVLDRSPGELFLIEGHTDAVGSEIDNLSLSDRRAETVAIILTDEFGIPGENLTTQGYGEEYLKEMTDGPSWINRRVGVRRITPLLSRDGWDDAG